MRHLGACKRLEDASTIKRQDDVSTLKRQGDVSTLAIQLKSIRAVFEGMPEL